jgi:predicted RNase H-like nuclease
LAFKTIETDHSRRDAYSFIGKLYADSYERCKEEVDRVKDRLVFIAAYQMFQKAGDMEAMKFAKEQFPSREELFERNYNAGQSMKLTCWIDETVILQTRD